MSEQKKTMGSLPDDGQAYVVDGWANLLTGAGVKGKDKGMSAKAVHNPLGQTDLEELYAADDIAQKIVDRLPKDGMREWIEFQNLDSDVEARMNDVIKKLDLKRKVQEAWTYSRLYGGSGLIINFGERINGSSVEHLAKPVNEESIRSIESLTLLNRYELASNNNITVDIDDPNFGLPETYDVTPQTHSSISGKQNNLLFKIHHSRVVRFDGSLLPTQKFTSNQYWHDSVLTKIFQILSSFNQAHQAASSMLLDFRLAVIKLKNLFQMVAQGDESKVKQRMELIKMQKSVINMVLLNEGEEFEHKTHSLAGVKEILDQVNNRMVVASGYPHTILLGESPSGLGASGQSEIRDYYDMVTQEQEAKIRKPLDMLFRYIFLSKDGPTKGKIPDNFDFRFVPLWQMTDAERAQMELNVAKKDEIYIANQVLDPEEVKESRYGGKEFSQDTKIINPALTREELEEENQAVQRETTAELEIKDSVGGKTRLVWDRFKAKFANG